MKHHYNRKIGKLVIIASISLLALFSFRALALGVSCANGETRQSIEHPGIEVIDRYDSSDGYYIFHPKSSADLSGNVIGFVHGYGAINPMIFGAWIQHLVDQGHVVIYPRYQRNLVLPSASQFTSNVASALEEAFGELRKKELFTKDPRFFLFGHSFGGVISANIAGQLDRYDLPKPRGVFVAEGGTGPFTGAMLENYSAIPSDIPFVITVGDRDLTVGDYFGRRLFQEMNVDKSVLIHQLPYSQNGFYLTASHYEPYAIDDWCDNGIDNLTTRRARHVGKLDELDYHGYWKWLDALIHHESDVDTSDISLFDPMKPFTLNVDGLNLDGAISVTYGVNP